jgi:hypothetical protein
MDGCREERVDPDPVREMGVGRGSLDADADKRKADGAADEVTHQVYKRYQAKGGSGSARLNAMASLVSPRSVST